MIEELTLHIAAAPEATLPGRGDTVQFFDSKGSAYTVRIHRVLGQETLVTGVVTLRVLAERVVADDDCSAK